MVGRGVNNSVFVLTTGLQLDLFPVTLMMTNPELMSFVEGVY